MSDFQSAKAEPTYPEYRPDIDGLRAVAVLLVVGFHAFPGRVPGGFIGVDIFFVISGFLISSIIFRGLASGNFSFQIFYSRRVRRIFPALLTVLMTALFTGWFALYPDEFKALGKHVVGGAGFVSNFVLWQENGYFDVAAESKPLLHLWSLGIEEQFYILFPLLAWAAWRLRARLLTLVVLLGLFSFLLNAFYVERDAVWTFYQPQTRAWELMAGAVLALLVMNESVGVKRIETALDQRFGKYILRTSTAMPEGLALANFKAWLGCGLLFAGLLLINKNSAFPGFWALLPVGGASLLIWAGPRAALNRQVLSRGFMVWIGKISYPLYLWHWIILVYLAALSSDPPSSRVRAIAVFAATVLSWLTYRFIEQPLRFGGNGRVKVSVLLAAMTVIAVLGTITWMTDGFASARPNKNSMVIKNLLEAKKNGPRELSAMGGYRCFQMPPDKDFEFFGSNHCLKSKQSANDRTVMLIGDSHSASLSLGLRSWSESRSFNYYQISSGACSLLSDDIKDTRCQLYSQKTFEAVKTIKPDILIIDSWWSHVEKNYYRNTGKWPNFIDYLTDRMVMISALGAKSVLVIGEVPAWQGNLPDVLIREFVKQGAPLPDRTYVGINPDSLVMDGRMRGMQYPKGFDYISLKDALCNAEGCRTRVGEDWVREILYWDYGHLTAAASRVVVDNIVGPVILNNMQTASPTGSHQ